MDELLHIFEDNDTERFIPYRRAAEYAKDMKDAGRTFKVVEDWRGKDGETVPVAEERRDEFLTDMKAAGVEPQRVRPLVEDGIRVFHMGDGETIEVANHREEEFFSDMAEQGREVLRDEPSVRWLSEKEADKALEGGIDWGELGKSATQGWKYPTRLAMNVAEGVVAIPTLAVMAGEYGLAKAGALEEGAHPLGKHGLRAMQAIEDAKPEYNLDTGSESWRDPAGIVHNVMSGTLGALEFIGEIAATAGVGGLVKKGVEKVGMTALKSGAMKTAKEAAKETAEAVGKRAVATEAERRAARKAAETLGVASVDIADRAAATAFAEAYARQLPRELLKEGSRQFAKQALKPNYWKLNMASRNALETYEAFASTGSDEDRAMLSALGDGALGYLTLSLGDGAGAFAGGLRATGATQILRALTQGKAAPWLKAEMAGAAVKVLAGMASQGGSTYGHLRTLQEALGEEAVSDAAIWGATATSGLFGAAMGGLSSIRPIRQAWMYDKELALGRQAMADGGTAWRPRPGQQGWARLEFPEGGTKPDGMPGAQSPASFRPVAVHADGDILFGDGSVWRAKTNDWRLPNGAVVDGNGDVVTVSPDASGGAQVAGGATVPDGPVVGTVLDQGQQADETLGLFELIRSGETKVFNVPLSEIQPNTQILQFKADADPVTGVVRGQELQGEFQALPSKPVLLWQAADGHIEPATGRHRIDLARRNGLETIPANVIRETDGWTPERTRLLDAMDNILDEKGSDQDFVAFFRGAGLDRDAAARKGLLARKKGRDAFEIAQEGSEDLYSLVMGKDPWVTPEKAAAIAREAPRALGAFAEGAQRAVAKAVRERNLTADGAAIMARGLMAARRERKEAAGFAQDDLFGADDTALAFAAEEASFADGERRKALRALQRLTAAMSKGDALSLKGEFAEALGIKNPSDREELKATAERLRETATRWENYHTDPELYHKAHAYATEALGIPDVVVERADGALTTDRELDREQAAQAKPGDGALSSIGPIYSGAREAYDKPSLHYVGTGEGAQVYGWGLYASDRPGVARSYADRYAVPPVGHMEYVGNRALGSVDDLKVVLMALADFKGAPLAEARQALEERYVSAIEELSHQIADGNTSLSYQKSLEAIQGQLEVLRELREDELKWVPPEAQKGPAIHEQTWWTHRKPGDVRHLLMWDGEVTREQRRWIRKRFHKEGLDKDKAERAALEEALSKDGHALHTFLSNPYRLGLKGASEFLYRAGIDGVKYPVNASKGARGEDGWNYVAFSDEHLRVDKRKVWNGSEYVEDERFLPEEGAPGGTLFSPAPGDEGEVEAVRRAFTEPNGEPKAGWMRARNGKPTKLSERQWLQARTPSFKRWFGDWENDPANASKVVDENGEPLVVYHRTDADFRAFDMGRARQNMDLPAAYFSSGTEDWGEMGERVVAAFLNLRNPKEGKPLAKGDGRAVRDALMREGYDGTIEREEGMETEYGVFDPKAIKSATDNSGAFDPNADDILMSPAPEGGVLMSPAPGEEGTAVPDEAARRASMEAMDAAANGPGFVPLEKGESFGILERGLKANIHAPLRNERLGLASSIGTGKNISKLSFVNHKGGEDANAHKYAMKNLAGLYANASVAVRHADKKLVGNTRSTGRYVRLFTPFRFNGQTYVALISQRESEVPGVHAIEALEVMPTENAKAEDGLAFTSRHGQDLRPDGSASPIHSALTGEKIAYTLGDVNLTRPERLDGTPYPADALLEDVQDAVARFELKAAGRASEAAGGVRQTETLENIGVTEERTEADSEYLDAVERGDTEGARRMVEEAAKRAGYTIPAFHGSNQFGFTVFDPAKSDDKISLFFAGTAATAGSYADYNLRIGEIGGKLREGLNLDAVGDRPIENDKQFMEALGRVGIRAFDPDRNMYSHSFEGNGGDSFLPSWRKKNSPSVASFSFDEIARMSIKDIISFYNNMKKPKGSYVYQLALKLDNPLTIDAKGKWWNEIPVPASIGMEYAKWIGRKSNPRKLKTREFSAFAKAHGYDGVIFKNIVDVGPMSKKYVPDTVYIVFDGKQVKSLDPVTYDDEGNVIPLSRLILVFILIEPRS